MKQFAIIIFFLLSFGAVSAQSVGNSDRLAEHSAEERIQIPEWFLDPYENEYVGVSVSSSSPAERMCSALISALLAYEAQISRPSATNRLVSKSDGIRCDMLRGERKIEDNISYRIGRQFVNENGELFIALQITPNGAEYLQLAVAKALSLQKDNGTTSWECEEIIECRYPELGYSFSYREKNQEIQGCITMAYKNQSIYCDLKELSKSNYADMKNSTEELGGYYDCHDSLHAAYMQALCSFIVNGITLKYPCSLIDNRLIFYAYD